MNYFIQIKVKLRPNPKQSRYPIWGHSRHLDRIFVQIVLLNNLNIFNPIIEIWFWNRLMFVYDQGYNLWHLWKKWMEFNKIMNWKTWQNILSWIYQWLQNKKVFYIVYIVDSYLLQFEGIRNLNMTEILNQLNTQIIGIRFSFYYSFWR